MTDADHLLLDALRILEQSAKTELEIKRCKSSCSPILQECFSLYIESASILLTLVKCDVIHGVSIQNLAKHVIERGEKMKSFNGHQVLDIEENLKQMLSKIAFLCLEKAITFDESKAYQKALMWYTEGSERFLSYLKLDPNNSKIKLQITSVLERAEKLKKISSTISTQSKQNKQKNEFVNNSQNVAVNAQKTNQVPQKTMSVGIQKEEKLTTQEIESLKKTSCINGKIFLPWLEQDAHQERFYYFEKFNDPDGLLPLSNAQKKHFFAWKRPSQFMASQPKMISLISAFAVTQSVVTDCSFVSSLIVAAAYERRFRKPLITNLIYPQNKQGVPIYNESGKYMIKLYFNGVARKVIIDDQFPVSENGEMLCCHSNTKNELWVSLLEKAYMKFHGGYQFPGSNSGIDLHALTGWIPEDIHMDNKEFSSDTTWKRMMDGVHLGACLITVSTGDLSEDMANALGLQSNHAYAVLDVRQVKQHKLLQVKNPWTRQRWKGKFSPHDKNSWTRELLRELNYDLLGALQYDNGVFWLDYDSLCKYFQVIHISWNPDLFSHTQVSHATWNEIDRPLTGNDKYTYDYNPQYLLKVHGKGSIWIMLGKHVTNIDERNQHYLTLHVYSSPPQFGGRIYHRSQQLQPISDGVYSNNPLYRICINNETSQTKSYTLIVSQYDMISTIYYTLRVFSSVPCSLVVLPRFLRYHTTVKGIWNKMTSGGSCNHSHTFGDNPQYIIQFHGSCNNTKETQLVIKLETPNKDLFVNVLLCKNGGKRVRLATTDIVVASSGNYRNSFCVCSFVVPQSHSKDIYTAVISTFNPGETGTYQLTVESSHLDVSLECI